VFYKVDERRSPYIKNYRTLFYNFLFLVKKLINLMHKSMNYQQAFVALIVLFSLVLSSCFGSSRGAAPF